MADTQKSQYPECEKMSTVQNESRAIFEFLDWLDMTNRSICTQQDMTKIVDTGVYPEIQFYPEPITKENLLAEHFDIDLDEVEREKQAMLTQIRKK